MKILVVEDNAVTATLMAGILTRHGYTVVVARNGFEGLRLLGTHPDIRGMITDIMMPESSGLELLRSVRENAAWKNLPIIVTSARDDPETVAQAVSLGCTDYLLKPVRPARLIERVTKVFRQEKTILMGPAEVMNRYSLNLETYREIARNFATQVDQIIAALESWSTRDSTPIPPNFSQIIESAALLGAERLISTLDEALPSDGSPPLNPIQFARLLEDLQLVRKALRSHSG
jgi:two-component system chemotaxis response regulator CheY